MGKTFESYIDLSGSLSTVSIALNGLLKINGPLTQVRNYYHIDVKHEIGYPADGAKSLSNPNDLCY